MEENYTDVLYVNSMLNGAVAELIYKGNTFVRCEYIDKFVTYCDLLGVRVLGGAIEKNGQYIYHDYLTPEYKR